MGWKMNSTPAPTPPDSARRGPFTTDLVTLDSSVFKKERKGEKHKGRKGPVENLFLLNALNLAQKALSAGEDRRFAIGFDRSQRPCGTDGQA